VFLLIVNIQLIESGIYDVIIFKRGIVAIMKKKIVSIVYSHSLCLSLIVGCEQKKEEKTPYLFIYIY